MLCQRITDSALAASAHAHHDKNYRLLFIIGAHLVVLVWTRNERKGRSACMAMRISTVLRRFTEWLAWRAQSLVCERARVSLTDTGQAALHNIDHVTSERNE